MCLLKFYKVKSDLLGLAEFYAKDLFFTISFPTASVLSRNEEILSLF